MYSDLLDGASLFVWGWSVKGRSARKARGLSDQDNTQVGTKVTNKAMRR